MSLCEWPEVTAAIKHKRCEIVLKDVDFSKRTPSFDEETIQEQLFYEVRDQKLSVESGYHSSSLPIKTKLILMCLAKKIQRKVWLVTTIELFY